MFSYIATSPNAKMESLIMILSRELSDISMVYPMSRIKNGIPAPNDMFKEHSWFFRNALVRASYKGLNISPTKEFVERFLRNVILDEKNELRNRE